MKKIIKHIGKQLMVPAILLTSWTSCINEDLSECGKDYSVRYDVHLVTNLDTELEAELKTEAEKELGRRLKRALSNVFTDKAKDLDLAFYTPDSLLSYREQHFINANTASYTIYLPVRDYQHLALANDDEEPNVQLVGEKRAPALAWEQVDKDTVDSYVQGLFSARLKMAVEQGADQQFLVNLYMQNSGAALAINPQGVETKSIRGVLSHLADGFSVRDSVYHFHDRSLVRLNTLEETGSVLKCIYGVGLPSRDVPFARSTTHSTAAQQNAHWEMRVYVTLPDGKVTETVFHVKERLKAGNFKLIKANLQPDGSLVTDAPEVGASVELDWQEGGIYNPEI